METSKVYFTDFKTSMYENLLKKLHRLMKQAGFESIDFEDKFTAIKMHFGEYGNLAFLRPNYAKVVADYVKELSGRPFLTDCNTLYVGSRKNALDHIDTAYMNGFSPMQVGCNVIIADGLKGTNETLVPVNGEYVKEAKIGSAVMDADVFISLTHFKGHEEAGFGGAMKNIMAVAVGISDGYGFGDNTKAMLMTRGIAEMARLGQELGGDARTFSGLSGVGDLIVTCISQHSRNRRFGLLVGGGMPVEQALEQVGAVVEGYFATRAVHQLTADKGLDMPICQAMYHILMEHAPLDGVITALLGRVSRAEHDAYEAAELWK